MRVEHFAFNVTDPPSVAAWYCEHLGFTIRRRLEKAQTHFLLDSAGQSMVEIYDNPPGESPDYASMNPLQLHLAFVSADPNADAARLCEAGATEVDELQLPDGSHLKMLKDPWGFSLQLCKRGEPML